MQLSGRRPSATSREIPPRSVRLYTPAVNDAVQLIAFTRVIDLTFAIQMADPPSSSAIPYDNPPSRMATYTSRLGVGEFVIELGCSTELAFDLEQIALAPVGECRLCRRGTRRLLQPED